MGATGNNLTLDSFLSLVEQVTMPQQVRERVKTAFRDRTRTVEGIIADSELDRGKWECADALIGIAGPIMDASKVDPRVRRDLYKDFYRLVGGKQRVNYESKVNYQ